ncbi:MAG: glycine zipper family protein [Deltaproteobacteria bacterium]|nr:glycine zipper family protein [Deltaproteobacteria bacterium]
MQGSATKENENDDLNIQGKDRRISSNAVGAKNSLLALAFPDRVFVAGMLLCALSSRFKTRARSCRRDSKIPLTQLYFYPKASQANEQQSRDHYECYNWAVKQTGFDPGQSAIPKDQRVRVVPMPPPGHDTATLAIAGAVLGALIGGPRHAVKGALIGASGGAIAGAASDSARMESARQQEEAYAAQGRARNARLEANASRFRRAMSACMEGRDYSVR